MRDAPRSVRPPTCGWGVRMALWTLCGGKQALIRRPSLSWLLPLMRPGTGSAALAVKA